MHYDGSFEVSADRTKTYEFATDPSKIATIFPSVTDVRIDDTEHFAMRAEVGVSFIKGVMDVECTITKKIPLEFVKLNVSATGIGSAVEMETGFLLEDAKGGGTLVKWTADAKMAGLMVRVGSRLVESAAEKYISQIVDSLKRNLR